MVETAGVGFYAEQVLPRIVDVALRGRAMTKLRRRTVAGLSGDVLEIGFGSGRNLPLLPDTVTRLLVVEPSAVAREMAQGRIAERAFPVEFVGLTGESLPLDDASVDHALSTWTLCTIPDVDHALREVRRVLKPGGTLHFVEHGSAPQARVRRWQDRMTPVQRRVAGGCHLNRAIDELVTGAGFRMQTLDTRYAGVPKMMTFMYCGVATRD